MAIRKRGSRYQVYWTNPFTKRREARAVDTLEAAEKLEAQIKYQLKYERERFRPDVEDFTSSAQEPSGATIEELHYRYLAEKQFDRKSLSWQLDAMRPAYKFFGDKPVACITSADLDAYKASLMTPRVKPVTVRGRLSVLRTVLRWNHRKGMLDSLPQFPDLPAARYEHVVPPSRSELTRMIEAAPEHIRRVIILGSQTGGRVGPCELLRLRWDDVDLERGVIRMPSANKNMMEPWREIPIRESLRPILERWKADGAEYVIHYQGHPARNIGKAWRSALRRAGITRRIRPYDLRHFFATELIAAGVDLGTCAKLLGHTSTDMLIQHYQHVMTQQKKQAIESLPDVPALCQDHCAKKLTLLNGQRKPSKSLERETGFEPATFSLGSLLNVV